MKLTISAGICFLVMIIPGASAQEFLSERGAIEYRGHVYSNDRDFRLRLRGDKTATVSWIGSAGRTFRFTGAYTGSSGNYDVKLEAEPGGDLFHRALTLFVRTENGAVRGEWQSDRQKAIRDMHELVLISSLGAQTSSDTRASTGSQRRRSVGMIRTNATGRTQVRRQAAAMQRKTARTFRTASRRISKAANRLNRQKRP